MSYACVCYIYGACSRVLQTKHTMHFILLNKSSFLVFLCKSFNLKFFPMWLEHVVLCSLCSNVRLCGFYLVFWCAGWWSQFCAEHFHWAVWAIISRKELTDFANTYLPQRKRQRKIETLKKRVLRVSGARIAAKNRMQYYQNVIEWHEPWRTPNKSAVRFLPERKLVNCNI